jgi:hypothetical protein
VALQDFADGAENGHEGWVIIPELGNQFLGGLLAPILAVIAMGGPDLLKVGGKKLSNGKIDRAEDVAQVTEPGGKPGHIVTITEAYHIEAKGRARGEEVVDDTIVLIAHTEDGHLHGYDAALAVILHDFEADVFGGDELADEAIIVNMDIINKAKDPVSRPERNVHQGAERRYIYLGYAAASREAGGAGAQQASDLDLVHCILRRKK